MRPPLLLLFYVHSLFEMILAFNKLALTVVLILYITNVRVVRSFSITALSSGTGENAVLRATRRKDDVARVVVVGAGVGGMAVASRIASSSAAKVIVLEKNSVLGGRCGSFDVETSRGTFRHERGPSLLLLKQVYQDLFQDCSGKTSEHYGLEVKQCIPAYQVVFDDGDRIELGFPSGSDCMMAEQISRSKMDTYEMNGSRKWDEYMRATAAFLDCGLPNFIEERLDIASFPAFLREALRDGAKVRTANC